MLVPNITEIVYGRDVGYKITQETFNAAIASISATKIRKELDQLIISLAIGATEMVIKPFIYWCHKRVWSRVKWGHK